jgi:hypothetical protein
LGTRSWLRQIADHAAAPCSTAVEERIAAWTQLPVYNGEGLQVLRYQQKQHYGTHWVRLSSEERGVVSRCGTDPP